MRLCLVPGQFCIALRRPHKYVGHNTTSARTHTRGIYRLTALLFKTSSSSTIQIDWLSLSREYSLGVELYNCTEYQNWTSKWYWCCATIINQAGVPDLPHEPFIYRGETSNVTVQSNFSLYNLECLYSNDIHAKKAANYKTLHISSLWLIGNYQHISPPQHHKFSAQTSPFDTKYSPSQKWGCRETPQSWKSIVSRSQHSKHTHITPAHRKLVVRIESREGP